MSRIEINKLGQKDTEYVKVDDEDLKDYVDLIRELEDLNIS